MTISKIGQLLIGVLLLIMAAVPAMASELRATYLSNLSNFNGMIPYNWVKILTDEKQGEAFVFSGAGGEIFNGAGMEVYHFDFARDLGAIADVAVDGDGNMLLLTLKEGRTRIVRCDYRGEPVSAMDVTDFPLQFEGFTPGRMVYLDGRFYLASQASMQFVVIDGAGSFLKGVDIAALLNSTEQDLADSGMEGFAVTKEGGVLFTVPVEGKAYLLDPSGKMREFGKRGSAAGRFGVPSGIAVDREGNYLVADKLRCTVLIFNKDFKFIKEFGERGFGPGDLIVPSSIAVDAASGRVYVSQLRRRGVSVFQLSYD
jgi:DNA-binding beta-propeller fold protein YncE